MNDPYRERFLKEVRARHPALWHLEELDEDRIYDLFKETFWGKVYLCKLSLIDFWEAFAQAVTDVFGNPKHWPALFLLMMGLYLFVYLSITWEFMQFCVVLFVLAVLLHLTKERKG
jgi:hypothetical protein